MFFTYTMLLPPFSLAVDVHRLHSLPGVSSTHARCEELTGRPHAPQPSVTGTTGSTGMMVSSK